MKITFRIVSDFDLDQEQKNRYELFPNFDASSPSARNIPYMKRKANRERYNGSTLTSFLVICLQTPHYHQNLSQETHK